MAKKKDAEQGQQMRVQLDGSIVVETPELIASEADEEKRREELEEVSQEVIKLMGKDADKSCWIELFTIIHKVEEDQLYLPEYKSLNAWMSAIAERGGFEKRELWRRKRAGEAYKARGGQVYYLHNRVDNIESTAAHVSQMVPGARVGIAHGKMTEEELNPVWQHLLNGEIDILVCTTLIETGIDVRNCNTLIIEDADRMGLAQLYQIRGRVGRSGRKAYAYFTFRRDKTLTDIAQKRLSAIREFTAFGSGFRIAMRDLQIRGAGSLLGHSQHGHMEAVGYDLYVKMLGQAIARAKGEPIQRDKSECLVDLRVDAFIPEKYIADGPGRIEAYKRIAAIQTPEDAADVLDELIDRYGDPPPSVSDLVSVSLVRVQAAAVGVYEVTQKKDTLLLQVETLDVGMIRGLLIAFNGRVTAGAGTKPYLSVVLQPDEKPLELLQSILRAMADILAAPQEDASGKK